MALHEYELGRRRGTAFCGGVGHALGTGRFGGSCDYFEARDFGSFFLHGLRKSPSGGWLNVLAEASFSVVNTPPAPFAPFHHVEYSRLHIAGEERLFLAELMSKKEKLFTLLNF